MGVLMVRKVQYRKEVLCSSGGGGWTGVVLGSGGRASAGWLACQWHILFSVFFLSFSGLCLRFSGRWSRSLLEASSDKHGKHAQAKMVIH